MFADKNIRKIASEIRVFKNAAELAAALAADFQSSINRAAKLSRRFNLALSGGTTPALLFQKLVSAPYRENIAWHNVHFFWGDERGVPPNHPDSNFGMTKKQLLDHITIPQKNIHRILGENEPEAEAARYAREISHFVPANQHGTPQFDWILLGLGTDGHTASIFPGSDVLDDRKKMCAVARQPETGQKRITLTLPVINNARRISFLVAGEKKASMVAQILNGTEESKSLPASFVQPVNGSLEWYLDQAAGII